MILKRFSYLPISVRYTLRFSLHLERCVYLLVLASYTVCKLETCSAVEDWIVCHMLWFIKSLKLFECSYTFVAI